MINEIFEIDPTYHLLKNRSFTEGIDCSNLKAVKEKSERKTTLNPNSCDKNPFNLFLKMIFIVNSDFEEEVVESELKNHLKVALELTKDELMCEREKFRKIFE